MSIRVRGNGGKRRASGPSLVRSIPAARRRVFAGPLTGKIIRYLWPVPIEDYNELATLEWSSGQFFGASGQRNSPPYTFYFGGELWDCLYAVMPADPVDGGSGNISCVLPPLRLQIDEAAVSGEPFDYWRKDSGSEEGLILRSTNLFSSSTLLPLGGGSHISAGSVGELFFSLGLRSCEKHVWNVLTGYGDDDSIFRPASPLPGDFRVYPRYVQLRQNGSAVGPLYDLKDWQDYIEAFLGQMRRHTGSQISFQSSPNYASRLEFYPPYDFSFVAGDEFEMDVWYAMDAVPEEGKVVIAAVSQGVAANQSRLQLDPFYVWTHAGLSTSLLVQSPGGTGGFEMDNLEMMRGFNPAVHTYTFTPADGWSDLGTARPIVSPPTWSVVLAGSPTGGSVDVTVSGAGISPQTYSAEYNATAADLQTAIRAMSGTGLDTANVARDGSSPNYTYTISFPDAMGAIVVSVDSALEGGLASVEANQVHGYSSRLDPRTLYFGCTSDGLVWMLKTPDGYRPGIITLRLSWWVTGGAYGIEIPTLEFSVALDEFNDGETYLPAVSFLQFFRPASNGAYVDTVSDRNEGSLTVGPCGTFNHLGTTVFQQWNSDAQSPPYTIPPKGSSALPYVDAIPSTITVAKAYQ